MARRAQAARSWPTVWRKHQGGGGGGINGCSRRISLAVDESTGERLVAKPLPGTLAHAARSSRTSRPARLVRRHAVPALGVLPVPAVQHGWYGVAPYLLSEYCEGGRCRLDFHQRIRDLISESPIIPPQLLASVSSNKSARLGSEITNQFLIEHPFLLSDLLSTSRNLSGPAPFMCMDATHDRHFTLPRCHPQVMLRLRLLASRQSTLPVSCQKYLACAKRGEGSWH